MIVNDGARAFGKVILVGEHAVVHGVPAIAVGIDRGAHAHVLAIDAAPSQLTLRVQDGETLTVKEGDNGDSLGALGEAFPLGEAFTALVGSVRRVRSLGPVAVDVHTDLPAGAGLGCSAAIGVAIARALGAKSNDEARDHAMAWERVFHGNPSGIDAAIAAMGGAIVFAKKENASVVEPLRLGASLVLAVGHSGVASSTRAMVESVARLRARNPSMIEKTFEGIAAITRSARLAIEAGDVRALGKLLDMNQMLLAGLLLSTEEIESMCVRARSFGALGAKLTGAGGGGCVVALAESRAVAERVIATWKADGFSGFVAEVSAAHDHRAPRAVVEAP